MNEIARENGWQGFRSIGRRVEGSGWEFTCDGMPTMMGCGAAVYVPRRWSKVGPKSSGWLVTYGKAPKPEFGESASVDEPEKWQDDRDVVLAYCPSCRIVVEQQEAEEKALLRERRRAQRQPRRAPLREGVTRKECPECHEQVAVTPSGHLRKHPKPPADPCPGATSHAARRKAASTPRKPAQRATTAPADPPPPPPPPEPEYVAPEPVEVEPGVYRSGERMLHPGEMAPEGHATLLIRAHVPLVDGRTGPEQAALLYEDPGYLSQVLDAVPNDRIEILLKVGDGRP